MCTHFEGGVVGVAVRKYVLYTSLNVDNYGWPLNRKVHLPFKFWKITIIQNSKLCQNVWIKVLGNVFQLFDWTIWQEFMKCLLEACQMISNIWLLKRLPTICRKYLAKVGHTCDMKDITLLHLARFHIKTGRFISHENNWAAIIWIFTHWCFLNAVISLL